MAGPATPSWLTPPTGTSQRSAAGSSGSGPRASSTSASSCAATTTRSTRYLTERIASLDGVTALEVAPIIRTVKRAATVVPAG